MAYTPTIRKKIVCQTYISTLRKCQAIYLQFQNDFYEHSIECKENCKRNLYICLMKRPCNRYTYNSKSFFTYTLERRVFEISIRIFSYITYFSFMHFVWPQIQPCYECTQNHWLLSCWDMFLDIIASYSWSMNSVNFLNES